MSQCCWIRKPASTRLKRFDYELGPGNITSPANSVTTPCIRLFSRRCGAEIRKDFVKVTSRSIEVENAVHRPLKAIDSEGVPTFTTVDHSGCRSFFVKTLTSISSAKNQSMYMNSFEFNKMWQISTSTAGGSFELP